MMATDICILVLLLSSIFACGVHLALKAVCGQLLFGNFRSSFFIRLMFVVDSFSFICGFMVFLALAFVYVFQFSSGGRSPCHVASRILL